MKISQDVVSEVMRQMGKRGKGASKVRSREVCRKAQAASIISRRINFLAKQEKRKALILKSVAVTG